MNLAEQSLLELFPEKKEEYEVSLAYSGKFSSYNGNVIKRHHILEFGLSNEWKGVSAEIQMGLIQLLLCKVFKTKRSTHYMDMYHSFMKKIHIAIPKTESDELLEKSFDRVNDLYFNGLMEKPNLVWCDSINKLGSYEYGSDRISISEILRNHLHLLDYVMYHEMLHKKHKFRNAELRSLYHTKEFRADERSFEHSASCEEELKRLVRRHKMRSFFF